MEGIVVPDARLLHPPQRKKVLNSELEENDAKDQAEVEVEARHKFLARQDVDRILEMTTQHDIGTATLCPRSNLVHAPYLQGKSVWTNSGWCYRVLLT